ncbi:unnamed protein product [Diatraea saccharalis]|uniref:Uncharacterized protein n=1 Tax=Diatraea saccharalis TaxID=40085 RepID=A0A9N9R7E8_9NEOP|nr:unnamed protein product [Diatraea saccharalis]
MALSAAERQRRCREKRKLNPEHVAEVKRKDLERYHARKKLVKDMTPKEHKKTKRQWQIRNKKRRERQKTLQNVLMNTPTSTPPPSSPRLLPLSPRSRSLTPVSSVASSRGRKQVRRDRSRLYRQNIQLQNQTQELLRKVQKYKKRLQRLKKKRNKMLTTTIYSKKENEQGKEEYRKYTILSNTIKKHYKNTKDHKTKRYIKSILEDPAIQRSGQKLQLAMETIGIRRVTKYSSILPRNTTLKQKIHDFYLRDDVSRATAGKKETVTYRKRKMQKRILLDTKKNLYKSFLKEDPNVKCHYSYFAKFKPFYVLPPSVDSRETYGLTETEIALHIDFSENYACKYHEEIQSVHFGGSRNQVTLHTAVLYHLTFNKDKNITSFCTVSSDLQHGPAAIWAHLHPILDYVQKELSHIKTIHIFSDGPATQYKQKNNFYLIATRFFEEYRFDDLTWNFFESGHGKGAADGIGGSIKRLADHIVASGHDIVDASQFFDAVNNHSKIKVFFVGKDNIAQILVTIPQGIPPLKGTMQVHQLLAQQPGMLSYRMLSCFCGKFCDCYNLKTYCPLPKREAEVDISTSDREEPLTDITNIIGSNEGFYKTVYTSTSEDEDDQPLLSLRKSVDLKPGTSHDLLEDKIHPSLIKNGTHILVKVLSERKIEYTYLGVAKSGVDEDRDVRVMFYKSVDDTGKMFKLVETDVLDVMYENLLEIIPPPKLIKRGKRVFYEYNQPIEVFEK